MASLEAKSCHNEVELAFAGNFLVTAFLTFKKLEC